MTAPPTGTVTFLFTDIEGSTTRWEHHREAMAPALDRHNALIQAAIDTHDGVVFKTMGDAYCAAFADASNALAASLAAQRALAAEDWARFGPDFPFLRVRMALHTGLVEHRDSDYHGLPVNRVARVLATAHGGQVVLSLATQQLVRDTLPDSATLLDLGVHRLKDLKQTEHLFRLVAPGFADVPTAPDTAEALPAGSRQHVDVAALPTDCPYRGLFAFREEDAAFFFGREAFTERLAAAVGAKRMVGVIGPSGSGKSSVVFAGLVPRLRDGRGGAGGGNGAGTSAWTVLDIRPGARPFHALAGALVPVLEPSMTEADRLIEVNKVARALDAGDLDVPSILGRVREKAGDIGRVLLVADQFEELYTLCSDPETRHRFLDTLFAALVDPAARGDPPLTLVLTLRADFMGHALAYRPFSDALQDHQVNLGPMTHDELTRAIVQPAEKQGRAFESGLPERLLADLGDHPGNLPLLEFALSQLWDQQQDGWLTHEAYDAIGHVEGALARYADEVYGRLPAADKSSAERVFLQLVRPGEGTEDTRRLATHTELGEPDWDLVRRLADARLVVTDRDATGLETAEVVHEALIRSWGRLRAWMDANRAFRTWQERLRFALRQWEGAERDEGALLRGAPLAEAEGWLKEQGSALGQGEQAFVAAGLELRDREAREREAQRKRELSAAQALAASALRLRRRAVWLAGALVLAAMLAAVALISLRRAEAEAVVAKERELAAAASASLSVDPERSALLALQAVHLVTQTGQPVPSEALSVLHGATSALHMRLHLPHRALRDVAFDPSGSRIATAGADGTVKVWNVLSGTVVITLTGHGGEVKGVRFGAVGNSLITWGKDQRVDSWDSNGTLRWQSDNSADVLRVAANPNGNAVAIARKGLPVEVVDSATGATKFMLAGPHAVATWVGFTRKGSRVLTTGDDGFATVWETATGTALLSTSARCAQGFRLLASPDEKLLAVGCDKSVNILDLDSGRERFTLEHPDRVTGLAFSPTADRLVTVSYDKAARMWDMASGRQIRTIAGHTSLVNAVDFSPDGRWLATSSLDKTARIWDADTGREVVALVGHSSYLNYVRFSPDGQSLLTKGGDDEARLWTITADHEALRLTDYARSVALSPDGNRFAIGHWDSSVDVRDAATGEHRTAFPKVPSQSAQGISDLGFSPAGKLLAAAGPEDEVRVWNVGGGPEILTLRPTAGAPDLDFNTDGTRIATAGPNHTAQIWDTANGKVEHTLVGHTDDVNWVKFSPDGRALATASQDGTVRIWSTHDGKPVRTLSVSVGSVSSAAFSPDGHWCLAASSDARLQVWDVSSGEMIKQVSTLMGYIAQAEYTPDGKQIIALGGDATVRGYSASDLQELFVIGGSGSNTYKMAISPDGRRLLTTLTTGTFMYLLRPEDLIALARSRLTRTLTPEECRQYLHVEACPAGE